MSYKKVGSWFVSEAGRKFSLGVGIAAGLSAFCVQYVPNTFLIENYKSIVHCYRNGVSVPLQPKLLDLFKKTIDLAEISESTKRLYSAFSVVGFDIFSAGSTYSKYGCIIGLPVNFTYENVDTIDKSNIKILSETVVWDSQEAKDFLNSQILSDKAKMYAMAREMRMKQTLKLYIDSFYGTICVVLAYGVGQFINTKFNLYAKPVGVRMSMYGLVGTFWLINYFFVKDFTQLKYEHQVDEELKHLNPIFVEGAVEFYDKILKRNKALRKLMGSEGESMYSVHGNENYLLRQKHLPLVQRKAYFESTLDPKDSFVKQYT